jgi:hypothetical protein
MYSSKGLVFLEEPKVDQTVLAHAIFEVSGENTNAYYSGSKHCAALRFKSHIREDGILIEKTIEFYKDDDGEKQLRFIVYGVPDITLSIKELLRTHRTDPKRTPYIVNTFASNLPIVVDFSTDKITTKFDHQRFYKLCQAYLHECFNERPPLDIREYLDKLTIPQSMRRM